VQAFGLDVVSRLCQQLLDGGAPSLHFYTMNQAAPSLAILKSIQ
jgi:methylenetetrahydrofolate reductase (NADPH)